MRTGHALCTRRTVEKIAAHSIAVAGKQAVCSATPNFSFAAKRSSRTYQSCHTILLTISAAGGILLGATTPALAVCTPPAGPSMPAPGTTVICTGTTGSSYGNFSLNGLTVNVKPGASVAGLL